MAIKKDNYWFKAKRYGWGWYPSSWQGWLVLGIYLVFIIRNAMTLNSVFSSVYDITKPSVIQIFILTILLVAICYLTGEPPRWRWGEEKKKK